MQQKKILERFRNAGKRLLLLDYDGTLVGFSPVPGEAVLSAESRNILEKLSSLPLTKTIIITGRSRDSIEQLLGTLKLDVIAEHGALRRIDGQWLDNGKQDETWKVPFRALMEEATGLCPGTFIEEKRFSLSWHYRNATQKPGEEISRQLLAKMKAILPAHLKILDGNKVIEIMEVKTGKGNATRDLLAANAFDFVLAIGDDKTDEEMFAALPPGENYFSIKVGEGETLARERLESVADVTGLLSELVEVEYKKEKL